jgi:hypothetical protein
LIKIGLLAGARIKLAVARLELLNKKGKLTALRMITRRYFAQLLSHKLALTTRILIKDYIKQLAQGLAKQEYKRGLLFSQCCKVRLKMGMLS